MAALRNALFSKQTDEDIKLSNSFSNYVRFEGRIVSEDDMKRVLKDQVLDRKTYTEAQEIDKILSYGCTLAKRYDAFKKFYVFSSTIASALAVYILYHKLRLPIPQTILTVFPSTIAVLWYLPKKVYFEPQFNNVLQQLDQLKDDERIKRDEAEELYNKMPADDFKRTLNFASIVWADIL